jgi:hypothetical protein
MLYLRDGTRFAFGRKSFRGQAPGAQEPTDKIFVELDFQDLPSNGWLAQIDTGAAYSMLEVAIAETLDVLDGEGQPARVLTRLGPIQGRLERIPVSLVAEEGESLEFEATFLVSHQWPEKTFIGYTGFLDRIRIALDPSENFLYFGGRER